MSTELDDMGLDDLDLDFEDQFPDFDDMNEDVQAGNRDPLDSLKTAGMDTLTNTSTYTNAAQKIAKNALPDGYSETASGLGKIKDIGEETLEAAKKELGDTGKILRDIALKNEGLSSKILPESFLNKLKNDKQREGSQETYQKADVDQATIQAALGEIFKTSVTQDAENNEISSIREEAVDSAKLDMAGKQVSGIADIRNILSRMVSFNDNIAAGYYSKSLELQFKQYFALRDILKSNQAYYADTKTLFEGVLKNTALPDILKSTMSEEYFFQSQEALLGRVNEGINKNLGGYLDKFKTNVVNKGKEIAGSIRDGVGLAGDILNNDLLDDLSPSDKEELIAAMAYEQAIGGLAGAVGSKLAKVLEKHPDVAGLGLELLYLQNNAPFLLDELVTNGDDSEIAERLRGLKGYFDDKLAPTKALLGNVRDSIGSAASSVGDAVTSILPERVRDAYNESKQRRAEEKELNVDDPFADIEERKISTDSWYVNLLRDVLPSLGDNEVSFNNTLLDDGYKSVSLDLAMRTSVVDIMPGLLTEAVRQLTILNEGTDENALAYDPNSGYLKTTGETQATITDQFLTEFDAKGKQQRIERILAMLDPEGLLEPDEKVDVSKALISMANGYGKNKMFTYDNLLKELSGNTKDKVAELTGELKTGDRVQDAKYNNFFTREYGNLRDGFDKAQDYVSDLKIAGGSQQLVNSGLLVPDPKDPTRMVLNKDMFLDGVLGYEPVENRVDQTDAVNRFRDAVKGSPVETLQPVPVIPEAEEPAVADVPANVKPRMVDDYDPLDGLEDTPKARFDEYDIQEPAPVEFNLKADVIRDALMDKLDGKEAIPVYLALEQASAESDPIIEAINTLNQTSIDSGANTHALLAQIHEAVASLEAVSTNPQARVGILSSVGDFAQKLGSGAGSFFKKYYQGASMGMRAAGSMGGSLLSGAGQGIGSVASALFGKRKGGGDEDDVDAGGNNKGGGIAAILSALGAPVTSLVDFQKSILTDTIPSAFRMAKGGVKAFNDKVEDVYVSDEQTPRLLASVMRKGGYFSEATGERIYSHKDIDGNVVDKDGNVILAMDELSSGLTNRKGKELSKGRIMDALSSVKDAGIETVKTSFDLAKRGAMLSYNVADKSVETFASWFSKNGISRKKDISPTSGLDSDIPTIDLIYKHMTTKWPLSKEEIASNGDVDDNTRTTQRILEEQLDAIKMQGESDKKSPLDRDGDGFRDGSWQAKKAQREATKEDGIKSKKEEKKEEKTGLMAMLAPLIGVLGTAASGVGTLVTAIAGMAGLKGASGLMDDMGGFDPDTDRNSKRGPKGRSAKGGGKLSKLKNLGGKLGRGALRSGGSLLRMGGGAARVGLQAALWGGRALLGAGAAVVSAPLAMVATIGTAAYLGYKGVKWLAMRSDAEPLEELRFLQYGINLKQGGVLSGLRYLEEFVLDEVDIDDGQVLYSRPTNEDVIDVLGEEMDLDQGDAEAVDNALKWFDKRFVPVLLHHTGVAAKIDSWIDIDDIDDEIDDDDVPKFLTSIMTDEMSGSKFYKVTNSPGPGIDILDNKTDVESRIAKLMKKYSKEEAAKLEKKLSGVKDGKAKAEEDNAKTASVVKPPREADTPEPTNKRQERNREVADKAREYKRKMIARNVLTGNIPDISPNAIPVSEETLSSGSIAYKIANGDILVDTKGTGRVESIEEGVIDKFGESKGFGKYIEINTPDGRNIVYKNLSDIPNDLVKGKIVKVGDEIGRADSYRIGNARSIGLNVVNRTITDDRKQGNRDMQDAAIAAASLPLGQRDTSLKVITDTLAKQNRQVDGNVISNPNQFVYTKPVPVNKPIANKPVKPVKDTRVEDMNSIISGTFNRYHTNSIKQRDKMITLLEEIKTLFSSMEITLPDMQPQQQAPQVKARAPKVTVPVQFKKPNYV